MNSQRALRAFLLTWMAAMLAAALSRPPLPPDELRYLAVAWEMHAADVWLLPTLNGEPYPHKPPVLFWLLRAGWLPFGPSILWARCLQILAGALALWLTARLARALLPDRPAAGAAAALALGGTVLFQAYSSLLFFDLWLTVWILTAWLGLLRACQDAGRRTAGAWLTVACAGGAALLTKGPVALLVLLPPILLRPIWWGPVMRPRAFWTGATCATLGAAALALAWAIPAAQAGGADYARAIFLDQTAQRLGSAADHARPFWWYLALLPILLAPAALWPGAWRGAVAPAPRALRFALCAFLPALLGLSAVAGKQPHYLLPVLPALAVALASRAAPPPAPPLPPPSAVPPPVLPRGFLVAALGAPVLALAAHLVTGAIWGARYDVRAPAHAVAAAQQAGRPVAFFGMAYHGAFHFPGRLRMPLDDPPTPRLQRAWLHAHPDGLVVLVLGAEADARWLAGARATHPFGTRRLALWDADALLAAGYLPRPRAAALPAAAPPAPD